MKNSSHATQYPLINKTVSAHKSSIDITRKTKVRPFLLDKKTAADINIGKLIFQIKT